MRASEIVQNIMSKKSGIRKKTRKPFVMWILGAAILLIILFFFIAIFRSCAGEGQTKSIDERLKSMEERLGKIEAVERRLSSIEKQLTDFQLSLTERMNSLEKYLSRKTVTKAAKPESGKRRSTANRPQSPDRSADTGKTGKKTKHRYHQVKAGETLFKIGLRYDLTVDGLCRLNNLKPGAVLSVGQKLIVGPVDTTGTALKK